MTPSAMLEASRAARARIAPFVRRTPSLVDDGILYKLELLQLTGSFKPRGAFNAALSADPAKLERGIVAVSGGNHGLAIAHVGKRLGVAATVVMPVSTPGHVIDRARADGAEIVLTETIADAFEIMEQRKRAGQTAIHPFDDERVVAGQGTIGFELLEDFPELDTLIVSIGGGGLIAGIAAVVKEQRPTVRIFGVETDGADAMRRALDAGRPVELAAITSIAKTLGAPHVSPMTLAAAQRLVENVVVVPDAEAVRSIVEIQETLKVLVEPAASCCHAALRLGVIPCGRATAILLCGGNITLDELAQWRRQFLTRD